MKRVLLASTALMMVAGAAVADVKFSGYQRFGIKYVENRGNIDGLDDTEVTSRFRLNIDALTETDQGVKLEARVRLQASDGNSATLNGARFSAAGAGLRVDIGNIAGAIDNLPNYYGYEIGLTDFLGQYNGNNYNFDGYSSSGDGEDGVYARYAFGAWAVAASYSNDRSRGAIPGVPAAGFAGDPGIIDNEQVAVHVAYTGANWGVALGYADSKKEDTVVGTINDKMWVATGNYDFGTVDVTAFYADADIDDNSYGLSANIEVGAATSIQVAWGDGDSDFDDAYGIGFKQNLGGGAFLRGGIGSRNDTSIADLGVRFDF